MVKVTQIYACENCGRDDFESLEECAWHEVECKQNGRPDKMRVLADAIIFDPKTVLEKALNYAVDKFVVDEDQVETLYEWLTDGQE